MKKHRRWPLFLFSSLALVMTTQKVIAIEALSAKALARHCAAYPDTPEHLDAQFCIRYIQGFIDGAIATDTQVMLNLEAEYNIKETYAERAMRTRIPNRKKQARAARYAEFCLGEPLQLRDIVEKVVTELNQRSHIEAGILARAAVYGVLRKHYPCQHPAR
ncbi:MAG TPA: hypothetical protein ENJ84_07425 [Gammaproteobacteria bacterium]|nr:hypothetical protein [Gammaproteobacteria bacterium]